jgi:septin 1 family protein
MRKKALESIVDERVHCVLYFFGGGHTIKKVDFKLIRKIEKWVNVIPVISMGDSFSKSELSNYKVKLGEMANKCKVRLFNCKDSLDKSIPRILKDEMCPPFAILNPNEIKQGVPGRAQIDGNFIRVDTKELDF